jgi:hypothetical protein
MLEDDPVLNRFRANGIQIEPPFAPRRVSNPNIIRDLKSFIYPDRSLNQIKEEFNSIPDTEYRKTQLRVVIDRLEFVQRLLDLRRLLIGCKRIKRINVREATAQLDEEIEFHGMDFTGIDYDIESLSLYLLLTCIDVAVKDRLEQPTGGNRFKECTKESLSPELRKRIVNNFALISLEDDGLQQSSEAEWNGLADEQKIDKFLDFLYKEVRCTYTHMNRRTFLPETPVTVLPRTNDRVIIGLAQLENDNLLAVIKGVVVGLVRCRLFPMA